MNYKKNGMRDLSNAIPDLSDYRKIVLVAVRRDKQSA
jgi:hypothetical protein